MEQDASIDGLVFREYSEVRSLPLGTSHVACRICGSGSQQHTGMGSCKRPSIPVACMVCA